MIPPTLGASAWSAIASCGRHDVFTLSPVKGGSKCPCTCWERILQANLRELHGWEHHLKPWEMWRDGAYEGNHIVFTPNSVLGWNHSGVPLERVGCALPFSQERLTQLLPFHHLCSNMLALELLEELTCANPPGPRSVPVWHCVVTLTHSPWPGTCSSTLNDPIGTGPPETWPEGTHWS